MSTPPTIVGDASLAEEPAGAGPGPGAARKVPRRAYRLFLARGVVALSLGIALLLSGSNLSRLTTFVAVYWIAAALLTLRWVVGRPTLPHRWFAYVAAVTGLAAGALVVLRGLLDLLVSRGVLLDVLALSAIATGLLRLSGLLHDDQLAGEHPRRRYRFVIGTLEILLGVALLVTDEGATTQIRVVLAAWGLATGTFLLLDAFTLRRLTQTLKETKT